MVRAFPKAAQVDTLSGIPVLDASGVALAAIQGLKAEHGEMLAEQDERMIEKDREIAELREALDRLRQMVSSPSRQARLGAIPKPGSDGSRAGAGAGCRVRAEAPAPDASANP